MAAMLSLRAGNAARELSKLQVHDECGFVLEAALLAGADLCGADIQFARFLRCDLRRVSFRAANLCFAELSTSLVAGIDLRDALALGVGLRGRQLTQVHMERADLGCADMRDSCLREAHLDGAVLDKARLAGSDLCGASLLGASLRGADLRGAWIEDVRLNGAVADASTRWPLGFDVGEHELDLR